MLSSGIAADSCQGDSGGPLACANPASSDTTVSIFFRQNRFDLPKIKCKNVQGK